MVKRYQIEHGDANATLFAYESCAGMKKRKKMAVEKVDLAVDRKLGRLERKPLVRKTGKLSEAADQPPLIMGTSLLLSVGLLGGNRRLAQAGVRTLATELLGTAMKALVKDAIDRTRPFATATLGYQRGKGRHKQTEFSSFPSGHTAGAVGVARAFVRDYPAAAIPAAALATAVAGIQVPRRAHWLSDVIAGAAIGLAAEFIVNAVVEEFRQPDRA